MKTTVVSYVHVLQGSKSRDGQRKVMWFKKTGRSVSSEREEGERSHFKRGETG